MFSVTEHGVCAIIEGVGYYLYLCDFINSTLIHKGSKKNTFNLCISSHLTSVMIITIHSCEL